MTTLTLAAPAKINLSLRVLRRREDGFHDIHSLMVPLALEDTLTLTKDPDLAPGEIVFTCTDPTLPSDASNLAVRAIQSLSAHCGGLPGLRLHLEKRIPHGAGLGGGSSDAASALAGVNTLCGLGLSIDTLSSIAAGIGSDVPFFLHRRACIAEGRGELIHPVPEDAAPPPLRILLVKPPFGIPTPWAYQRWRDSVPVPGLPMAPQPQSWGILENDLERPVFEKYPVLGHLKARLLTTPGVTAALMSGSGSTVFAILQPDATLPEILTAIHDEAGDDVWTCDTATC